MVSAEVFGAGEAGQRSGWYLVLKYTNGFCLKNCLTEEHIRALLQHFQYSEQFKETAAFRIVFGGEEPSIFFLREN